MEWETVDMRPGANAKKNQGHGDNPSNAKKKQAHLMMESAKQLADEAEREEKERLEREAEQARQAEEEQLKQAEDEAKRKAEQEYQDSLVMLYKSRIKSEKTEIEALYKGNGGQLVDPEQLAMHNSLPVKLIAKNRFASLQERGNYFELVTSDKNSPALVNLPPLGMCRLVKHLGLEYIQKY